MPQLAALPLSGCSPLCWLPAGKPCSGSNFQHVAVVCFPVVKHEVVWSYTFKDKLFYCICIYFGMQRNLDCFKKVTYICHSMPPYICLCSNQCTASYIVLNKSNCFSTHVLFCVTIPDLSVSYVLIPVCWSCTVQVPHCTGFLHVQGSRCWRVEINCIGVNCCWPAGWYFYLVVKQWHLTVGP